MADTDKQMELLGTDENSGSESTPSRVFPAARIEKRGPGRPKGAVNKKTEAIGKLYQAKGFRDPLLFQGELMSAHPVDLRKWFIAMEGQSRGLSYEDALKKWKAKDLPGVPSIAEIVAMQAKMADQVTPYLYGKKPLQSDDADERLPMLLIDLGDESGSGVDQVDEDSLSIGSMLDNEVQQNQPLSKSDEQSSHDNASHETANSLKDKGE